MYNSFHRVSSDQSFSLNCCKTLRLSLRFCTDTMYEPPHDKTNNVVVRPAKTQISLGI